MTIGSVNCNNYIQNRINFKGLNSKSTVSPTLEPDKFESQNKNKKKHNTLKIAGSLAALGFAAFAFAKYAKGETLWEKIKFVLSPVIYIP